MAPIKKPQSAYFQFSSEKRKEIAAANPGLRVGEVQKLITTQWKELSDEQKQVYIDLAAKDKERYEREKLENPVEDSEAAPSAGVEDGPKGSTCIYPLGRVKRIIQSDPDVNKVSREALIAIAKASELFAQFLATKSYEQTLFNNKRQIKANDVSRAIHITTVLDWLRDDFADIKPTPKGGRSTASASVLDDSSAAKPKPAASSFFSAPQPQTTNAREQVASEDAAPREVFDEAVEMDES